MARFDVFRRADGAVGYLLDCQADLLLHLNTRLVVPLLPLPESPRPAARLNPVFSIEGVPHSMVTQFAAAVLVSEIGPGVASLATHDLDILNALDMLITGL